MLRRCLSQPSERAKVTLQKRVNAAKEEFHVGPTCHITNGDEKNVPDFVGQFHKSLPHDKFGNVHPEAYEKLLDCVFSADITVCDKVPSGAGRSGGAKLINPLGGTAHQIDGADRCGVWFFVVALPRSTSKIGSIFMDVFSMSSHRRHSDIRPCDLLLTQKVVYWHVEGPMDLLPGESHDLISSPVFSGDLLSVLTGLTVTTCSSPRPTVFCRNDW